MPLTQANRAIRIKTPLKDDLLVVRSFTVDEQLGRLFQIDLDLLSDDENVKFDDIVGHNVTLTVDLPDGEPRFFNGFVNRFVQGAHDGRYARYQATLVPWLWFLTRRADCRIFQSTMPEPPSDLTVPNIVKKVFTDRGFHDFKMVLSETYSKREYCVQYRETDFNFVSRLMEAEGIYYFFQHEDGKHTLVLADSPSAHESFPNYENIPFRPQAKETKDHQVISDWVTTKEVQPGIYTLNDFDSEKPKKPLQATSKNVADHASADYEIYDYPGEYREFADGETYARKRIEELHAKHEIGRGQATAAGICTGSTFSLEDYPRGDQNRKYLVTATSCRFEIGELESSSGAPSSEFCTCSFTAIPAVIPFRSARTTPKRSIHGVQTAIVVGPKGDEIFTDDQARVKVQFHWDRYGKSDENSSCWVRVSQSNAGKSWGSMITPRIGQEVIVEFLEGDPDRPIITGRVYNGDNKPPYANGQGVVSGLKSQTHKGSGFNEISMDDTSGKEKITIHGQYDMDTKVGHDFTETIKNDATIKITDGKYNHDVAAGTADYHVKGAVTEKYDSSQKTTVMDKVTIESTSSEVLIKAATKITLETGASKITLEAGGDIKIEGVNVTIKGAAQVESSAGATNTVKGSAMVTIKGGMVMVN